MAAVTVVKCHKMKNPETERNAAQIIAFMLLILPAGKGLLRVLSMALS